MENFLNGNLNSIFDSIGQIPFSNLGFENWQMPLLSPS
jgi:hypothetical protein